MATAKSKKPLIVPPVAKIRTSAPKSRRYVVTYAQNATPVDARFWATLQVYCKVNDAQLIIIPGRYTNPTSLWSQNMAHEEWWDPAVDEYLCNGRLALGANLTVFGDVSISPTARKPLNGFEAEARSSSAIFGHPRMHFKTEATSHRLPRAFASTGACTRPNYSKARAGKAAEMHHKIGALVVERGEKLFHIRQMTARPDGTFTDLAFRYTPEGAVPAPRALALVCGDIHVAKEDPLVQRATFEGPRSIARTLQPERILYHDVDDFDTRNHHSINSLRDRLDRALGHRNDSVEQEQHDVVSFLDRSPENAQVIVVRSNHDEAFDRWLDTADPDTDPLNARFFHEMKYKVLAHHEKTGKWMPALELFYREHGAGRARFLARDELLKIGGWVCNFHGDEGLNGARGTPDTFARLGINTITGHRHSPSITDCNTTVGVSGLLNMRYNGLPSSWLQTHAVIYGDTERSLISIIDGEWRA